MTITLDFSDDYASVWDNTEAVTLRSQSAPGLYAPIPISAALRGQPKARERAPTAGVYAGYDLLWCIPGALLTLLVPKPGDVVRSGEPADVIDWTVLSQDYDQLDQVYQLYCVNLVLALELRDTVTFWRPTPVQDLAGSRKPGFAPWGDPVAARIQLVSEEPQEVRGKRLAARRYEVYLAGEIDGLTHEWQLRDAAGGVYQITRYRNRRRIDELSLVECERDGD